VIWLDRQAVEAFHAEQLSEFGGLAGIRDPGALESAIARPLNLAAQGKPTVHELAAEYAFGIARNHPFADGNKRTALVACFVFLELNGVVVNAREEDAVVTFLELAAGKLTASALAAWLKENSTGPKRTRRK
jgi:death on curing protein